MKMQKVKRVTTGGYVKADVTGTGGWIIGQITNFDKGQVRFRPADGSKEVVMARHEIFRATKSEFTATANNNVAQILVKDQINEASDDDEDSDGVRLHPDLDKYVIGGEDGLTVTITNRKTVDINDLVAVEFRTMQIEEVYNQTAKFMRNMGYKTIGKKDKTVPTTTDGLKSKYEHLNLGMQRMNLGNLIRNAMIRLDLEEMPISPVKF